MGIEEAILQEIEERGIEKGVERGIEQGIMQTALRMKKAGVSISDIVRFTGLTKEQVEKLS